MGRKANDLNTWRDRLPSLKPFAPCCHGTVRSKKQPSKPPEESVAHGWASSRMILQIQRIPQILYAKALDPKISASLFSEIFIRKPFLRPPFKKKKKTAPTEPLIGPPGSSKVLCSIDLHDASTSSQRSNTATVLVVVLRSCHLWLTGYVFLAVDIKIQRGLIRRPKSKKGVFLG